MVLTMAVKELLQGLMAAVEWWKPSRSTRAAVTPQQKTWIEQQRLRFQFSLHASIPLMHRAEYERKKRKVLASNLERSSESDIHLLHHVLAGTLKCWYKVILIVFSHSRRSFCRNQPKSS